MSRNVTITLDEETARWVRVEAARRDMSVSKLIAALLHERKRNEEDREAATARFLSRPTNPISSGRYPRREDIHDRASLRRH